MSDRRYVLRLTSDSPCPDFLLRRLPSDERRVDLDLQAAHNLVLDQTLSHEEELQRRLFTAIEAEQAAVEWRLTVPRLDTILADARIRLRSAEADAFRRAARRLGPMRLLPLVAETGQTTEMLSAVPAWRSARRPQEAGASLFHRACDARGATLFSEVTAVYTGACGNREVSARVARAKDDLAPVLRMPGAEPRWLASHYIGVDIAATAHVLMTPIQAERLAEAARLDPSFSAVAVRTADIESFAGSAEFCVGHASLPVRLVAGSAAQCGALGQGVYWVVWPTLSPG